MTSSTPKPTGDYTTWLGEIFPSYTTAPLADHHHQLWRWVWSLKRGTRREPIVCIWPRGGAKSTSVELACVAVGARDARRYILYVSGTQSQADDHVQNVGAMLESRAVAERYPALSERSVGKYGASKGWRRNRLRTQAGLTVDALGLDVAARGVKLDEQRPDLIVFDDVDDTSDSQETVKKKVTAITQKILPAGSSDVAVMFVQNLVHYEGVAAKLAGVASEPADFLADRVVSGPLPALKGFAVEKAPDGKWLITAGEPIWQGQDVETCQRQIFDWGIRAFRAEAQHERTPPDGQAFPEWSADVHVCEPFKIPDSWPKLRAVDYGYAVPYCCLWMARSPSGRIYVYRETYETRMTAPQQAYQVRVLSAGERYFTTVGDPAMWAEQREGQRYRSVAQQYEEVGVKLIKATNNRLSGWTRMHSALEWTEQSPPILQVFSTCTNLIRTLPLLVLDANKPEDVDTLQEDHCFTPGTLITTPTGDVPISMIRAGDQVMTREGPKTVLRAWMTSPRSRVLRVDLSNSRSITGTANHPIWVEGKGWTRLDALRYGDIIQTWESVSKRSSSTVSRTADTPTALTGLIGTTTVRADNGSSAVGVHSIRTFGLPTTVPFQRDATSTIETVIRRTTIPAIWNACRSMITMLSDIASKVSDWSKLSSISNESARWHRRGTNPPLVERGIAIMENEHGLDEIVTTLRVSSVGRSTAHSSRPGIASARTPASQPGVGHQGPMTRTVSAWDADRPLGLTATAADGRARVRVLGLSEDGTSPVYNLTVADLPEYFANGVLVHNCADALRYGLMALPWLDQPQGRKSRKLQVRG